MRRQRGVGLIGDVPIYVAPGSYDQKAWPELFLDGVVAGVPPDAFTAAGQRWGNPIYDWPALQRRGYRWWVERFRRTFELYDMARIDHFRAFVAYWAVPAGDRDARGGTWQRGPGRAPFAAATAELGAMSFIAEDLGVITPPVTRLRRELGYPGMVVLQFAFDPDDPRGPHRLENHGADVVAYTGTHDTDTLRGWWSTLEPPRRDEALSALRAGRSRRRRRRLGAHPPVDALAGAAGDAPGPGRPGARVRGAHEPPGDRRRRLEVRAAARAAEGRARPPPPCRHRGGGPPWLTLGAERGGGGAVLALGDSILCGPEEGAFGVPPRSWAQWLAEALDLPFHKLAQPGATTPWIADALLPRARDDYALACVGVGTNDVRSLDWDPRSFEVGARADPRRPGGACSAHLRRHGPARPRPPAGRREGRRAQRDRALGGRGTRTR